MNDFLQAIVNEALEKYQNQIDKLNKSIEEPKSYEEAQQYALKVSEIIKNIMKEVLSMDSFSNGEVYYGTAKELLLPLLENAHNDITSYCSRVQTSMYKKIKIGLKPIKTKFNKDRAYGIIDQIAVNSEVNSNE